MPHDDPQTIDHDPAVTERGRCLTEADLDLLSRASLSTQKGVQLAAHVAGCSMCHKALIAARANILPRPAPPPVPPVVPGHVVEDRIGSGGFGEVWRGQHERLWQMRAFKVLKTRDLSPEDRQREMREARLMASLPVHPNRVQVHDLVECDGDVVVVMDYVPGGPLSSRSPMAWEQAVRYTIQAAQGLEDLHRCHLIHRDIKPSNLLYNPAHDIAVVADYGLAAFVAEQAALAGTAGYLAPELIDSPATTKSDVFALGCTLHALLIGVSPYRTDDPYAGLLQAKGGMPEGALAGFPLGVREAVEAALEPDPARRPDLPEFLTRLRTAHIRELWDILQRRLWATGGRAKLAVTVSVAPDVSATYTPRLHVTSADKIGRVEVEAGTVLEFATTSDQPGHLTMLNFDTAGSVDVLVPGLVSEASRIEPGERHRIHVQLTPSPDGDRAAIIWSPGPLPADPDAWKKRLLGVALPATRGMTLVGHWIDEALWSAVLIDVLPPKGA